VDKDSMLPTRAIPLPQEMKNLPALETTLETLFLLPQFVVQNSEPVSFNNACEGNLQNLLLTRRIAVSC
jgi:hypothetical protein